MRHKWKLVRVRLEIMLILTQDRYAVCAKHTIGSNRLEIVVILKQERCAVCVECTIGSKIVNDTLDGTLR
jgi:hypothetical protein